MSFSIKGLYTQGHQELATQVYPSKHHLAFVSTFLEVDFPTGIGYFQLVLAAQGNYFEPLLRRVGSFDQEDRRFFQTLSRSRNPLHLVRFCRDTDRTIQDSEQRRKIGKLIQPTLTEIMQLQQSQLL